jgi:Ca2+-transporting ATPase
VRDPASPEPPPIMTAAENGLTAEEAARRLAAEGPNLLPRPESRNLFRIVGEILREPMFALLLGAGAVYLLLGDHAEAVILFLFACTSVGIAVVQEARTERVLDRLRDLTSPRALVVRDGSEIRIAGAEIVRGDLIILAEGDRVPADATLLAAHHLSIDESLLTGEPVPVRKIAAIGAAAAGRPGGDDLPHVYSGSLVVAGHGRAKVTATGARSEIGRIGAALTTLEREPPRLQAETRRLVKRFAALSLTLSVLVVPLYGLLRGNWLNAVLSGIALGMSMLPEEFPLVLTVFLVMGAWRISRARVLTRRVAAIETLGAATVLCTDKTGTLTQNRMTIVELHPDGEQWRRGGGEPPTGAAADLVRLGILASAREPFDPMEQAFHALGRELPVAADAPPPPNLKWEFGLRPDLLAVTNIWELPSGGGLVAAAKGAPEAVAELCRLPADARDRLGRAVDELAAAGMRVLGVARAALAPGTGGPETPRGLPFVFLGLVGLADPLRSGVPAAVRECRSAGIRVVVITGDYPQTARAIAAEAGLADAGLCSGADLERMSDAELAQHVRTATIFARTMPEQKLRIVEALKAGGEVVAMTGDGVNDAPSLKAAHIGIAMGGRGTDVAREAASLVLLDDDFASIVAAVRLGRRIYDNLRKAMAYILAIHVPIAGLALLPLLLGLPLIFWPLHIAFLELVIDPMCSIGFEAEGEDPDIMQRPPRPPEQRLFSLGYVVAGLAQGAVALGVVAALFVLAFDRGLPEGELRALTFTALVAANLGLVLANRSAGAPLLAGIRRKNTALWLAAGVTSAALTGIIAFPPTRELFRFGPLSAGDVGLVIASGLVVLLLLKAAARILGDAGR